MEKVYETGLLTRLWIQDVVVYYLRRPRILSLANPVSNQNHKVIVPSHRSGNHPSTRVVFKGE
nr:MAG TPA: hypothetical protein [Caudoviricetes sp.]